MQRSKDHNARHGVRCDKVALSSGCSPTRTSPHNLYKLWNRLASGSYFPPPVQRVDIPKDDGRTRPVGIPRSPITSPMRSVCVEAVHNRPELLGFLRGFTSSSIYLRHRAGAGKFDRKLPLAVRVTSNPSGFKLGLITYSI